MLGPRRKRRANITRNLGQLAVFAVEATKSASNLETMLVQCWPIVCDAKMKKRHTQIEYNILSISIHVNTFTWILL